MVWQGYLEVCPYIHSDVPYEAPRMALDEPELTPIERLKAAIIAADVAACAELVTKVDRAKIFEETLRERWFQARVL